MKIQAWVVALSLTSTGAIAKNKEKVDELRTRTFEVSKIPVKHSKGLKLEKGWAKKVTIKEVKIQASLPRHFDWREQGTLTPIRNQGNCGSCWAFSSVEVFQDTLALRGQGQIALSPQYLLSCNHDGWSCDGGSFAHDYHMALPVGGVREADFPYKGTKVACKANLSHPYHITSWAYLPSPDENTAPTLDAMKSAIYQYGPIGAAFGANNAFENYTSGTFNQCDGTQPNHAIVLVGWDDDGQYFIMKNSWSAQWGQNGYANVKYGCNGLGIAANYIVYSSPAPTPTPTPVPPAPAPTPTPTPVPPAPTPVPKCTPQPYANAGPDVHIMKGQSVKLGTPAKDGTAYHWESSAGLSKPLNTAMIIARPTFSQIYTVFAHTKCGTARSSVLTLVH